MNPPLPFIVVEDRQNKTLALCRESAELAGEPLLVLSETDAGPAYERFCRSYVHLSSNSPEFEKICFRRYFLLARFLESHPEVRDFVLIDSDVLLFEGAGEHIRRLVGKADFSGSSMQSADGWNPCQISPHVSYVGAFKIAFLLAEAPSQFVQAFLVTRTPAMLETDAGNFTAARLRLARHCFLLGCALFAGLAVLISVAAPLLKLGNEARTIFLCIAPYFLLRTYTIHHETMLSLKTSMGSLGRWALLEVALRLSSYAAVVALFPERPHYVFFIACLSDFALYETRMRLHFGFFPIVRLLARRPAP